ncbi:MAG: hypothetical protein ACLTK0_08160 [Anaerovoracaceae bacterium]
MYGAGGGLDETDGGWRRKVYRQLQILRFLPHNEDRGDFAPILSAGLGQKPDFELIWTEEHEENSISYRFTEYKRINNG